MKGTTHVDRRIVLTINGETVNGEASIADGKHGGPVVTIRRGFPVAAEIVAGMKVEDMTPTLLAAVGVHENSIGLVMALPVISAAATRCMTEIEEDIAAGTVPADVDTFSRLHDYVDANTYGGLCDDDCPPELEPWSDPNGGDNWVLMQEIVDRWLQNGRA